MCTGILSPYSCTLLSLAKIISMKTRPIVKVFGLVFFTVLSTSFEHTTTVIQLPATVTVGIVVAVFINLPTHVLVFSLTTTPSWYVWLDLQIGVFHTHNFEYLEIQYLNIYLTLFVCNSPLVYSYLRSFLNSSIDR